MKKPKLVLLVLCTQSPIASQFSMHLQYKNQASLFLPCRFIELVSLAAPSHIKKPQLALRLLLSLVTRPGVEPRQTAPKTVVLPLYYRAIPMPFFEWSAKIGCGVKFSKYLCFIALIIMILP